MDGMLEELRGMGVDVDGALSRLGGNAALYMRLLAKLAATIGQYAIDPGFDASGLGEAREKAHTLKGTTGNLSLTPLYEAYGEITRLLREGDAEAARALLLETIPVQERIMECIRRHAGEMA